MTTKNFRVKIRKYSHDPIKIAPLTDSLDPPLCPHDAYRKNFFLDLTVDQWSTSKVYQFNLQFQGSFDMNHEIPGISNTIQKYEP